MLETKNLKIGVIYMYTSPSGKVYIGQTINERSRKNQHRTKTVESNTYFGKAIRKYGFENFKYEVLIKFKPTDNLEKLKRVLNKLEKRYIEIYNSFDRDFGYNLTKGGGGTLGYIMSEDTKAKLRENILNRSEEWNKKLSESSKLRVIRDKDNLEIQEQIKKNLDKGRISGKQISEETKDKLRKSSKNIKSVIRISESSQEIFDSIESAAKSIESSATQKTKANRISECCHGKISSYLGYVWQFTN